MMSSALLILNAGSSSLKFTVFPVDADSEVVLRGQIDGLYTSPRCVVKDGIGQVLKTPHDDVPIAQGHQAAIEHLFGILATDVLRGHRVTAVGHRIVHGGTKFSSPVRINSEVLDELQALIPLAPLHQPHNLAAIQAVQETMPGLPQVACFDTAFHRTMPDVAQTFALPRRFLEEGVRRYGFHGLSFEYVASVLPQLDPGASAGRTIIAHLGNGVSLCALRQGESRATTMGLTPLDGIPMGTRCGAIDPGVLLYLLDRHHLDSAALSRLLYHDSGLLGLSGVSSDMRQLLASDDPHAAEAVELFVYRVQREIGSLAAALGGLDSLIFTGGIGENSSIIRERIVQGSAWLGLELDEEANQAGHRRISSAASQVSIWVIPTNEELMIARHTLRVLKAGESGTANRR